MKTSTLVLALLTVIGAGCSTVRQSPFVADTALPNCFENNYSDQYKLFTIKSAAPNVVNQQCAITVLPRGSVPSGKQLVAGTYLVSVSNGGGGGAGGTTQDGSRFPGVNHSGGGGGGGAGAAESQLTVNLTEGKYRATIGAGGPGGSACSGPPTNFGGGPGWPGSPTNMIRMGTGEVIAGVPGAEAYTRPTRWQHDRASGVQDGRGGFGPGQTSGGDGTVFNKSGDIAKVATDGADKHTATTVVSGGDSGKVLPKDPLAGPGGGGGATIVGTGGTGGGDLPKHVDIPPSRGTLGSGGGGGSGDAFGCSAGANGGHGFVAFTRI